MHNIKIVFIQYEKKKKSNWFSPMREELRHFYKYTYKSTLSTIVENFFQPIITQNKKFDLIKVFKSCLEFRSSLSHLQYLYS